MYQRVVLIVLDGVGVGAAPDAELYGDAGAATLPHVAQAAGGLSLPNLQAFGLGNLVPIAGVNPLSAPCGCWGKMAESSSGKDSVVGHWELAGLISQQPFSVYPHGFPAEMIAAFTAAIGVEPLGNIAASGTDILLALGEEHLLTGRPIVYTSSDSVFQIAAHESICPPVELYQICRQMAEVLRPYRVCRIIARPFTGSRASGFTRTSGRKDFTHPPRGKTLLNYLRSAGFPVCGIGKISDLYANSGLTQSLSSCNNREGMAQTLAVLDEINRGLVMTNLVDFDMLYGHRLDSSGFAAALEEFDQWLPQLCRKLQSGDLLLVTADHGCDPTTPGTDHSREYVPLLAWSPGFKRGAPLGVRESFADVAATIAENFAIGCRDGISFLPQLSEVSG